MNFSKLRDMAEEGLGGGVMLARHEDVHGNEVIDLTLSFQRTCSISVAALIEAENIEEIEGIISDAVRTACSDLRKSVRDYMGQLP